MSLREVVAEEGEELVGCLVGDEVETFAAGVPSSEGEVGMRGQEFEQ